MSQLTGFLGREVKKKRKALKLSQEDIASKTGLSVPSLSEIERGIANPTLATLEKLAESLNVTVASLLDMESSLNVSPAQRKMRLLAHIDTMTTDQIRLVSALLDI